MPDKTEPKLKIEETNIKSIDIGKVDVSLEDPNKLLNDFLNTYNLKLRVDTFNNENPFIGSGFLLHNKPLLKISVEYKD